MTVDALAPPRTCHVEATSPFDHLDRPPRLIPAAVAKRYAAVAVVAFVLGAVHIPHRPATMCVFRAVTGLPCPFCGGTTAAVNLGHLDFVGALRASPLAVGLLGLGPLISTLRPPDWWRVKRNRWLIIGIVLVVSEVWQLVRFGIISW